MRADPKAATTGPRMKSSGKDVPAESKNDLKKQSTKDNNDMKSNTMPPKVPK